MSVNASVFSSLQDINPSAIIELFTLQLSTALHGANTIYRFHAGSNLNANGKIVWATNEYLRFPVQASGFAFQRGQLPRPKISISNATGLISSILLSVNETTTGNDLTGATVTRIRTLAKFIDAVNFADGTNATADPTAEFPQEVYSIDRKSTETREVVEFESYQLNGFVWDNLNMFEKFNPKLANRSFSKISEDLWSIEIPLKKNGGIDFRADGVYQFLISANKEENFGFSGFNNGRGSLIKGIGFSSSHGTSMHSAMTIKVFEDGIYKINLINPNSINPTFSIDVVDNSILKKPIILNDLKNYQLLGSIYKEDSFDPTKPNRDLIEIDNNIYQIDLEVDNGDHSINFALSNELFLDTMALGCWLDLDDLVEGKTNKLSGIGWHGKPHEFNIPFSLEEKTLLRFIYNKTNDNFSIEVLNGKKILKPTTELNKLSIVGDFDNPLEAWNPKSEMNLMQHLGESKYFIKINS